MTITTEPDYMFEYLDLTLDLRRIVDLIVEQLEQQRELTMKRLEKNKRVGDLRGCYAIKFDYLGYPNRFRLVFKYVPSKLKAVSVRLMAVGLRFEDQVYIAAAKRNRWV